MRKTSKIITALALAGLAIAGGAAFTAPGLGSTNAAPSSFVGGQIADNVTGAKLLDVDYTYGTPVGTASKITDVKLTFDNDIPLVAVVSIEFTGADSLVISGQTWTGGTLAASALPTSGPKYRTATFAISEPAGGLPVTDPMALNVKVLSGVDGVEAVA